MNHAITWNEYINVRLAFWAISVVVLFVCGVIAAIYQWHEDCHVYDDEDKETFQNDLSVIPHDLWR